MAADNMPNQLPRDASENFGNQLILKVWSQLNQTDSGMIYLDFRKFAIEKDYISSREAF